MKKNFPRLALVCAGLVILQSNTSLSSMFDTDFGGFGNINVKTGDITLKGLIRDINILKFDVTSCENSVVSSCGSGSVCNVTIGPCAVTTGEKLNAAPRRIVFSRYLSQINPYNITINKPNVSKPLTGLIAKHDYTTIVECAFSPRKVSYMFIALPTDAAQVNEVKNLPLGLANYLKRQKGTIIKIYRTTGNSSSWAEIAEINVAAPLSDKIIERSNIVDMEMTQDADLVLTYKNLKRRDGSVIQTTRVTYTESK